MVLAWICVLLCAPMLRAAEVFEPLTVRDVRVRGEIGRRIDITIANNLLALDAEKDFLAPFAARRQQGGYVGLGKLILAAVRFSAYRPDPRVLALKERLVSRTRELQEPDGYIGICTPASRMRGLWDVHEFGYIIFGLLADYEFFGDRRSLDAARQGADYLLAHWSEVPADWVDRTDVATHVAITGLERTMLGLYRVTRDHRYLEFVERQRSLASWDLPIVVGRRKGIEGHIYAYMARSLAMLDLNRLRPAPELVRTADRAVAFLTAGEGMAITGGAGQWEIWTDDQDGRGALAETCATTYQLRVYDSLLRLRGESRYGDLIERTVYNSLFAAQSPDGRRIRYYSPFEGAREYHPGDTYCCPCNYRRFIAELPEMIFYRAGNGIVVDLYAESEARIGDIRIRQETAYPSDGAVTLRVDPDKPRRFPLRLRIPAWTAGARISVNDAPAMPARSGTFASLDREWRAGDVVKLELPMPVRLVRGRERQAGRVAVMRGPLVFCLNPEQNAILKPLDGAELGRFTIDASRIEVKPDNSVRRGGIALETAAWKPGYSVAAKGELTLRLSEFPDPDGRATYFRVRDLSVAVADELMKR